MVFMICLVLIPAVVSCSNNGPVAPDTVDDTIAGPVDQDDGSTDVLNENDESTSLVPSPNVGTAAVDELGEALHYLMESGGGVLTATTLGADEFALHVWDRETGEPLEASAVVSCDSGPVSLIEVHSVGLYSNAAFPLTVTVYVPGYSLATVVQTSANVISLAVENVFQIKQDSHIFGIAQSLGQENMAFYSDTLIPEITYTSPTLFNPEFMEFNLPVSPFKKHGFSSFLFGGVELGDDGPQIPPAIPSFWMMSHFAWDFEPLWPGDNRYYGVYFESKAGPDGLCLGKASIPADSFDEEDFAGDYGVMVIPTAIYCEDELYLALGPKSNLMGEDIADLDYRCPWFDGPGNEDRAVIAGIMELPNGSYDIVHRTWHYASPGPDIDFSGVPTFSAEGGFSGLSLPTFAMTDPVPALPHLVRIQAVAIDGGPVWDITMPEGMLDVDTADFGIPLPWLEGAYSAFTVKYQVQSIDALSQSIDDFTEHGIIMNRRETAMSPWVIPQGGI